MSDIKSVKNIKKRKKKEDKKALKQFRFSEISSTIESLNKCEANQEQLDGEADEELEAGQNLQNEIESSDTSLSVSNDEVRSTPITEKGLAIPEEPRVVDPDEELINEDDDAE